MMALLLPSVAAVVETFEDHPGTMLYPLEAACVARAVESRRREFATGRHCARKTLAHLGITPTAIVRGERGLPRWPEGVVGSITHCAGYRSAAVARRHHLASLGIDAEPHEPRPQGVLELVSNESERALLAQLPTPVAWDRVLFSAKESVYKAWFPLAGLPLDFKGAELTFDAGTGTFAARLLVPGPVPGFAGRYAVRDGLIVTAVTVSGV